MTDRPRRILILNGHPDGGHDHFDDALAATYAEAARGAGHHSTELRLADLDIPPLASRREWTDGPIPPDAERVQAAIKDCDHLVLIFPLWLGDMPARVKACLEQVLRPGFALSYEDKFPGALLKGRSARVISTMGMPGPIYRGFYRAHALKALKRNILGFCGFKPVRLTAIGGVEGSQKHRERWLARIERMGRAGQ